MVRGGEGGAEGEDEGCWSRDGETEKCENGAAETVDGTGSLGAGGGGG